MGPRFREDKGGGSWVAMGDNPTWVESGFLPPPLRGAGFRRRNKRSVGNRATTRVDPTIEGVKVRRRRRV